jgi:YegS/Rv2252/BmrU family lipid kinase
VIVVNPRSGGGLSRQRWASLVGPLTEGLGPFDVRFTEAPGHGHHIALEEATAGRGLIVALGGDGTISEIVDGALASGQSVEVGVIPRGTGGDFRRTIDLPRDLATAARRVRDASPRIIDVGHVSFTTATGDTATRHFINVASFGFSADVAARANASSKRLGAKVAFVGAAIRSLVAHDRIDVWLSANGGERRRHGLLLGAIGNGRYFGGGMKICPEARLDDGQLDLVLVGELGRVETLAKLNRLFEGTHLDMKQVSADRVVRLDVCPVDSGAKIPIELDGETPGHLPATFEILPAALRLRC